VAALGGLSVAARPPAPPVKGAEPEAPAPAALFKAHVEGRMWGVSTVDADKKTLALSEQPGAGFLNIVQFGAGGVPVQLPAGEMSGLPLDDKAVVTINGKQAKLGDLKKGMTATVEVAPGKALIRRVAAFDGVKAETYTLTAIDLKKRTATLRSASRGVTLKDMPLAKAAEAAGYKAAVVNAAGVFQIGPGEKVAATLADVKPGSEVTLECGFEGGKYVITKIWWRPTWADRARRMP